jgi:hypothetical protein
MRRLFDTTVKFLAGPGTSNPGSVQYSGPCRLVLDTEIVQVGSLAFHTPAYLTVNTYLPVGPWIDPYFAVDSQIADQVCVPATAAASYWVVTVKSIATVLQPQYYRAYLAPLPAPPGGLYGSKIFLPINTYYWTVPAGISQVLVEVWSAGNSGGSLGGGGGGGYGRCLLNITGTTTLEVQVGGGGSTVTNAGTGDSIASYIGFPITDGGAGLVASGPNVVPVVSFAGGAGAAVPATGGGGGGAGSQGAGVSAVGSTPGTGVFEGGAGGAASGPSGGVGAVPNGGGGANPAEPLSAQGQVRITWRW